MAETLQDVIDSLNITARSFGNDYYWSSVEPTINKAVQDLRERIIALKIPTKNINLAYNLGGFVRASAHNEVIDNILELIGNRP